MNAFDVLGLLMQGGMGPTAERMQETIRRQNPSGMLGQPSGMPGGAPQMAGTGGGLFDLLGKIAGPMASGGNQFGGGSNDIMRQIGGAIFGGQGGPNVGGPNVGGSGSAAAGAGAMSIVGALAGMALEVGKQMMSRSAAAGGTPTVGGFNMDEAPAIIAGLRKPATSAQEQELADMATLTVRAMINAAKADGRIDPQEAQRLVGKMQEDGVTEEERQFVLAEMQKPMETDAIVRAVPNQQAAAQIYTASLMAIQVDTDAETRYLQELASKLGLSQPTVTYLHQAVGLA